MQRIFSPGTHAIAKAIYENIRNAGACTAVAFAGAVVLRFPGISMFGPKAAPWVGVMLVVVAALLFVWNMLLGIDFLLHERPPKSGWEWLIYLLVMAVFVISTVSTLGAAIKHQFAKPSAEVASRTSAPSHTSHP